MPFLCAIASKMSCFLSKCTRVFYSAGLHMIAASAASHPHCLSGGWITPTSAPTAPKSRTPLFVAPPPPPLYLRMHPLKIPPQLHASNTLPMTLIMAFHILLAPLFNCRAAFKIQNQKLTMWQRHTRNMLSGSVLQMPPPLQPSLHASMIMHMIMLMIMHMIMLMIMNMIMRTFMHMILHMCMIVLMIINMIMLMIMLMIMQTIMQTIMHMIVNMIMHMHMIMLTIMHMILPMIMQLILQLILQRTLVLIGWTPAVPRILTRILRTSIF